MFGGKKFVPPLLRKPGSAPDNEPASKKPKLEEPRPPSGSAVNARTLKLSTVGRKPLLLVKNPETPKSPQPDLSVPTEGYYNVLWYVWVSKLAMWRGEGRRGRNSDSLIFAQEETYYEET